MWKLRSCCMCCRVHGMTPPLTLGLPRRQCLRMPTHVGHLIPCHRPWHTQQMSVRLSIIMLPWLL